MAEYGQTRVRGVSVSLSYKSHKYMVHDMLVNFALVLNTVSQALQTITKAPPVTLILVREKCFKELPPDL